MTESDEIPEEFDPSDELVGHDWYWRHSADEPSIHEVFDSGEVMALRRLVQRAVRHEISRSLRDMVTEIIRRP
ncbi:MAG TPA: hypothetical protein VM011_03825 [Gammaproteobacteria bacterium]|nr:hypothetical protein [Gammaproteobacteria bacterium]